MLIIKSDTIFTLADGLTKDFSSPFAVEKFEKEKRLIENNAWRHQAAGGDGGQEALVSRQMLWGSRGVKRAATKPRMRFAQRVGDRLYYVLQLTRTSGLFYYDAKKDEEVRLFHREMFSPRGMHVAANFAIATTVSEEDGSSHVVYLDPDGRQVKQLTSGDCIDENPFISGEAIYYQSSGIGRTEQGVPARYAPAEILKLNMTSGSVETIKADPNFDYILPKVDAQGELYYIKAPYTQDSVGLREQIWDLLALPFRMVVAFYAFLNVFSIMFAKRPLRTSGGPPAEADMSKRMLHNRVVDIQKNMRAEGKKVAAPRDWKLVRLKNGVEEELAGNVLWYDIGENGRLVYTDGFNAFASEKGERRKLYGSEELVTCIGL